MTRKWVGEGYGSHACRALYSVEHHVLMGIGARALPFVSRLSASGWRENYTKLNKPAHIFRDGQALSE